MFPSGSVAGKSLSDYTSMDGMAPDAKITFFDIGVVGSDYLKIPDVEDIFDMAYESGMTMILCFAPLYFLYGL